MHSPTRVSVCRPYHTVDTPLKTKTRVGECIDINKNYKVVYVCAFVGYWILSWDIFVMSEVLSRGTDKRSCGHILFNGNGITPSITYCHISHHFVPWTTVQASRQSSSGRSYSAVFSSTPYLITLKTYHVHKRIIIALHERWLHLSAGAVFPDSFSPFPCVYKPSVYCRDK
jgi:hypothetical protein